jgi:hypothetical protein
MMRVVCSILTEKIERFIRRTGNNRLRNPSRLYDDLLTIADNYKIKALNNEKKRKN